MDGQRYYYPAASNASGGAYQPSPRHPYYQHQENGYYGNQSNHQYGNRNQNPRGYFQGGGGGGGYPQSRNSHPNQYHSQQQSYQQQQYHQQQQQSMQNSREPYKLSAEAKVFVPSSFSTPRDPQFGTASSSSYPYPADDEEDALIQLQIFITDVTFTPAIFESRVNDLTEQIFSELSRLPQNTEPLVKTIFEAGLLQQNFRYSGARLCDYLADLVVVRGKPIFRELLLTHLYTSVSTCEEAVGDNAQDKKVRGIALFCAELFSQLDLGHACELPETYSNIGPLYVDILHSLLTSGEKENQKSAIQAMKLSGGVLEKLCAGTDKMAELMETCGRIEKSPGVDDTIRRMLERLPTSRAANWGYSPRQKSAVDYETIRVDHDLEPVMYGPDGLPINAEEMSFLNAEYYSAYDGGSGDYGSHVSQTMIDDEALDDYEKFLRETGQK